MVLSVEHTQKRTEKGIVVGEDYSSGGLIPIVLVNPNDRGWTRHRYVLSLGVYGWTRLMVWANSLGDAFDEAADWAEDHSPGLFCDDHVKEEYDLLIAARVCPFAASRPDLACTNDEEPCERCHETALQEAEVDTFTAGNHSRHIASHDGINLVAEDPSREDMLRLLGRRS